MLKSVSFCNEGKNFCITNPSSYNFFHLDNFSIPRVKFCPPTDKFCLPLCTFHNSMTPHTPNSIHSTNSRHSKLQTLHTLQTLYTPHIYQLYSQAVKFVRIWLELRLYYKIQLFNILLNNLYCFFPIEFLSCVK